MRHRRECRGPRQERSVGRRPRQREDGHKPFWEVAVEEAVRIKEAGVAAEVIAVSADRAATSASGIRRVRAAARTLAQAAPKYAPACDIGERMRLLDNPGLVPPSQRVPANPVR